MKMPKKQKKEYYNFNDLDKFITEKYGPEYSSHYFVRDDKGNSLGCFWHWLTDICEIHNGSTGYIPIGFWGCENDQQAPPVEKEDTPLNRHIHKILLAYEKEFFEDTDLEVMFSW